MEELIITTAKFILIFFMIAIVLNFMAYLSQKITTTNEVLNRIEQTINKGGKQ